MGSLDRAGNAAAEQLGLPAGPGPGALTQREQLRRYQERTADVSWVDRALAAVQGDRNAAFWLGLIKSRGFDGLAAYVTAMENLGKGRA